MANRSRVGHFCFHVTRTSTVMAITFPAVLLHPPTPATAGGPVGAVAPTASAALLAAGDNGLPLPFSQPLAATAPSAAPAAPAAAAAAAQDAAAMRPDQVMLARQLAYPALGGEALAGNWRSTVRTYGALAAAREIQASAGQLSPAQLAAGQEGRSPRPLEQHAAPADAWRFTVHTGDRHAHTLQVVPDERPRQGRRRLRAALRLMLELEDGVHVVLQAEALPGGLAIDLCAPDRRHLERLAPLQPALEAVIERVGLRVVRWTLRDALPAAGVHAHAALEEAAAVLSLPVFRALAELALVLPALAGDQS